MPSLSNYPPGVSGNEPQITGQITEAICTGCGETFIPHGEEPEDLIHGEKENGEECGGLGEISGDWFYYPEPFMTNDHC